MDDRSLALLRQLMSEVEGAPFPTELDLELYAIWYEHAQKSAQEALQYLNSVDPNYGRSSGLPPDFS
jgi:hypothetical protein